MATKQTSDAAREAGPEPNDYPWLAGIFDAKTRHELAEEDHDAMTNVCILLLSIVSMGVLLGTVGVLIAVLT